MATAALVAIRAAAFMQVIGGAAILLPWRATRLVIWSRRSRHERLAHHHGIDLHPLIASQMY